MNNKNNFINYIRLRGILFLIGLAVFFISYEIFDGYQRFSFRAEKIRKDYITQQKKVIKKEVYSVVDLINYKIRRAGNVESQTKKELLEIISRIRFGKEGYLFVNKLNGDALVSNGKILSGHKKLWEEFSFDSQKMKNIFNMEYEAAQKPGGDYIYYSFIKLTDFKKQSPKVSFIYGIPDLQWIIGAGVYLDDVEKDITVMHNELKRQIIKRVFYSIVILIVVIFIFLILFSDFSNKLKDDFNRFDLFFKRVEYEDMPIDLTSIKFVEFGEMAKNANKTLQDKIHAQQELFSEREKLFVTIRSVGDGLITTDDAGKIELMNRVAEKLTGWSNEEAKGRDLTEIFNIINENTRKRVENPVNQVLTKHKTVGLANHTILISRDGTEYNIADSAAPIKDAKNNVLGVVLVFRDITEKYKMEKALRQSEEYFRALIENSSDIVSILDKDGRVIYKSPSLKNVLGYKDGEFLDKNIFELIHPDDIEQISQQFKEGLQKTNKVQHIHFRVRHKDGSWRYMEGTRKNLLHLSSVKGIVINYRDVTERVKAEKERLIFQNLTRKLSNPITLYSAAKIIAEEAYKLFEYDAFSFDIVDELKGMLVGIYNKDTDVGMEKPQEVEVVFYNLNEVKNKDVIFEGSSKLINRKDDSSKNDFNLFGFKNRLSKSLIFVPIKYMDKVVGVFSVQSYTPHKYVNKDLELLERFVDHIGGVVMRIKTEEKLRESELRLKTLIDATPDIICFKDGQGRWLVANSADLKLFSLENVDYYGKTDAELAEYTNPIYKDAFLACMETDEKTWEEKTPTRGEEIIPTVDGDKKIYDIIKVPIFKDDGTRKGLVVLGRDVTKRRKVEKRLEILYKAVEQSPVSIVVTNFDGEIEYVNPKFIETTGYTIEELLSNNPRILKSGEQTKEFYKDLWDTILAGNEWRGEFHNKKKSGEQYWESASISPIVDENGKIIHFVAVKEDITEKKKIINELIKAKEDAEKADKMKSIFLAQMSHEIRTPINALLSMSSLIKSDFEEIADEEQLTSFEIIERAGNRIIRTIDLLLNLSEIQTGTYKTNPSDFDLYTDVLFILFVEYKKLAEKKNILLTLKKEASKTELIADFYTVNQIFMQLIDNAIKYTDEGEVTIVILRNTQGKLVVEVKDTGIGIDEKYLPDIFEPFSQEEMGYTRKYEGNGLGMTLVKKYCELNNAEIEVESKKGKGSTFKVIF